VWAPSFVRRAVHAQMNAIGRADTLPGIQYTEPAGDPGLFGPDSAIWYVHSHYSTAFGAIATLLMQALEPGMGYAGVNNSKVLSEPFERLGRSASFVIGMTFASRPVTERLTRMVQAMHDHVSGELPDGRPYSANEPHSQRVAAVLFPLGVGAAHRRYHPRPLRGGDLDRFVADWAVISEALGATEVPRTWAQAREYAAGIVPTLELNPGAQGAWKLLERQFAATPGGFVARWAVIDLLAPWARRIYGLPDLSRAQTALARGAVFTALNGAQLIGGDPSEVVQARARVRNGRGA
jgi:uncharacterized protein (DUF2236 family)